jgi:hypothetical protein
MPQAYTPQGRQKTCPWISLRGKEWKALSEIRNSQIASVTIQLELLQIEKQRLEVEQKNSELLNQLVELQREKLHNQ